MDTDSSVYRVALLVKQKNVYNILSQFFFLVHHKQIRHRVSANSPKKLKGVASGLEPISEHPLEIIAKLGKTISVYFRGVSYTLVQIVQVEHSCNNIGNTSIQFCGKLSNSEDGIRNLKKNCFKKRQKRKRKKILRNFTSFCS